MSNLRVVPPHLFDRLQRQHLLLFVIPLVLLLPELVAPFNHDNELYQSMGWLLAAFGKLPYVQTWDLNFPGIIYIHAGIIEIFGTSPFAFRAFDLAAHLVVAVLIGSEARNRWGNTAGYVTAGFFAADYMVGGYWLAGQRDGFADIATLSAVLLYLQVHRTYQRVPRSNRVGATLMLVAGALSGVAFVIRPTQALFAACIALAILRFDRAQRWRMLTASIVGFLVATLLLLAPILLAPGGLHAFWLSAIRFNLDIYGTSLYREPWTVLFTRPRELAYDAIAVIGVLLYWKVYRVRTERNTKSAALFLFVALYVSSRVSVIVMGKFFIHHYEPTMVLSAMIVGFIVSVVGSRLPQNVVVGAALIFFVSIALFVYSHSYVPAWIGSMVTGKDARLVALHERVQYGEHDWELEYDTLRTYLHNHGDPQRVEVWGWSPGIYWRAHLDPSSRFTLMVPLVMTGPSRTLTDYQRAWQREYLDSLRSEPPEYFVVSKDRMGYGVFYFTPPEQLIANIPGLPQLLGANYIQEAEFSEWLIYRRR